MNPFTKILGGYVAIPSDPAQMMLYSMLGILSDYWEEDNSIITPTENQYRDAANYLTAKFGERHPVVSYFKTLFAGRLSR
ncbi:hypothetical protein [Botrimarina mediterranea]|uniref:Uncharacterized protein n=1 Tax=Botrimarina mediterranea TaxID=2528022 RepID=A0A518K3V5_9BACT|nr:hypothetical protein [Botrimarina mediterranea]QDV72478.1 hypothetical protein Spa11_06560 [Botrimarina mediterranea]QDV77049.1 hypothetical protein K2D_06360 [Planctomycetes bacterium K2D]